MYYYTGQMLSQTRSEIAITNDTEAVVSKFSDLFLDPTISFLPVAENPCEGVKAKESSTRDNNSGCKKVTEVQGEETSAITFNAKKSLAFHTYTLRV